VKRQLDEAKTGLSRPYSWRMMMIMMIMMTTKTEFLMKTRTLCD